LPGNQLSKTGKKIMQFVYFTVAGLFLYVAADWVLLRIEAMYGKRLPNRSIVFFGIILIMTMLTFEGVNYLAPQDNIPGKDAVELPANLSTDPTPTGPSFNNPVQIK
jgi:hypothetical protein